MTKAMKAALAAAMMMGAGAQAAGTVGYSLIEGTSGVTNPGLAGDGVFPADWAHWQTDSAWWEGTAEALTFTFDNTYAISGLKLTVDNNDFYRVQLSTNGTQWDNYDIVLAFEGAVDSGQETFVRSVTTTAPVYKYARVFALTGDGLYSVGEVQFSGTAAAVPEPTTAALMFAGLAGVGLLARRRRVS